MVPASLSVPLPAPVSTPWSTMVSVIVMLHAFLASIFCVFNDLDAVLPRRQAVHAMFSTQLENAHGAFFVNVDFNVMTIFAAQYGVLKDEAFIGW